MWHRFISSVFLLFIASLSAFDLPPSQTLQIPMRDGKLLEADFYLPSADAKDLPCILVRTPAGRKNPYALLNLPLLKEGYAIVVQETRSAQDPEGKTLPFMSDGWGELRDGQDTIEWLKAHPRLNGKIGTIGPSAMGITQLLLAPTRPEGLKAQYIAFACSDFYHQGLYHGGELLKHQVEGWLSLYAKHPDVYRTIYTQPRYNEFWTQFNMLPLANQCRAPALHLGGWYDTFLKGTLDAYKNLQESGGEGCKGAQKLVIGPWCHLWPYVTAFGSFDYPKEALEPPYDFSPERWFAHYLKGEENGVEALPPVIYYVMGPVDGTSSIGNRWKTAASWPLPTEKAALFLAKDQLAEEPDNESTELTYSYDPENPIPTLGGRNLFLPSGPIDQRLIEERSDVRVFTSPILEDDLEVTGDIKVVLYVESDQEDTAFSARLTDVYPDGKSLIIADGIVRLSHAVKEQSEKPHEIAIDLWPTSMVFAKGHQIRLIVSSSNYPRYEKHLNHLKRPHEATHSQVAKNRIFCGKATPSRLILPIVGEENLH